ncbi:uncharacterized protein ARMOST_06820 [Armillaria ostoyae]|uniref:Uncharacterized protein n=1 Tax=Armillaria ostoyae TaxID=47428 RepID=A0A284R419_ARMOS|nr:uncharacterized protein ARMOST_06820 [Armillaria ostoyae]
MLSLSYIVLTPRRIRLPGELSKPRHRRRSICVSTTRWFARIVSRKPKSVGSIYTILICAFGEFTFILGSGP